MTIQVPSHGTLTLNWTRGEGNLWITISKDDSGGYLILDGAQAQELLAALSEYNKDAND